MTLNVSDALHHPGQDYAFQGEQTIAPVDIGGDTVSFDTALLKGTFFTADDGSVTVDGRLSTVAHAHCANCLEPAMAGHVLRRAGPAHSFPLQGGLSGSG